MHQALQIGTAGNKGYTYKFIPAEQDGKVGDLTKSLELPGTTWGQYGTAMEFFLSGESLE